MEEETRLYYISIDECIKINRWAIENYGKEFGVIDREKLEQSLEIPKQVFFVSFSLEWILLLKQYQKIIFESYI